MLSLFPINGSYAFDLSPGSYLKASGEFQISNMRYIEGSQLCHLQGVTYANKKRYQSKKYHIQICL